VLCDIDVLSFLGRRSRRLGDVGGEFEAEGGEAVIQPRVNAGNRLDTFAECETGSRILLKAVECSARV